MKYTLFESNVMKPLHTVPRNIAEEHFRLFVSSIPMRIDELQKFVKPSNIRLDCTEKSFQQLEECFVEYVTKNVKEKGLDELTAETFSLCTDIGMYFGECLKKCSSTIEWYLSARRKNDLYYQRPVLRGFSNADKNYEQDFCFQCKTCAYKILEGIEEKGSFVRILNAHKSIV